MTDVEIALNEAFTKVFGNKFRLAKEPRQSIPRAIPKRLAMTKAKNPRDLEVNSQPWRDQVAMKLVDGYGAEDIAIWLNCHLSHVHAEIQRLRAEGKFKAWWGRE